jgi:hypothetical protein
MTDLRSGERCEGDESMWARDRWDNEAVEVVEDGSSNEFAEWSVVARVGIAQGGQIPLAFPLLDDRRRVTQPNQNEIQDQPTRSPVAVQERMDPFELRVLPREAFHQVAVLLREAG